MLVDQHAPVAACTGPWPAHAFRRMAGAGGQGRVAWAALRVLPDPPSQVRETPAQRYPPAEGRAGLSSMAFLAPFAAGGSPGPGSRARLADRAAATGRDRPLPGETVRFCVTRRGRQRLDDHLPRPGEETTRAAERGLSAWAASWLSRHRRAQAPGAADR